MTQCAAVKTQSGVISVPPQKGPPWLLLLLDTNHKEATTAVHAPALVPFFDITKITSINLY